MSFTGNALFLYDPKSEQYEDVQIPGIRSMVHAIAHVSSLVSLRDFANGQSVKMCRSCHPEMWELCWEEEQRSRSCSMLFQEVKVAFLANKKRRRSESRLYGIGVQDLSQNVGARMDWLVKFL